MTHTDAILWTGTEAAIITGGSCTGEWVATGVCIRMEDIRPGDLFFASPEDDLEMALRKGAAAAVVASGGDEPEGLPCLQVPDVFEALRALARAARFRTHGLVLAVQGVEDRAVIAEILSSAAGVHEAGRHLSSSMAAMPENAAFGVFGFSPGIRPDIAVITDVEQALNSTVLESLSETGIAVLPADDPRFLDILARAKADGVKEVYSYGRSESADIRVDEFIQAANGTRLTYSFAGRMHSIELPSGSAYSDMLPVSILVMHLADLPVKNFKWGNEFTQDENIQLLNGPPKEVVLKVTNMIDTGGASTTLVLNKLSGAAFKSRLVMNKDLEIPKKLDTLNIVCASKSVPVFANVRTVIRKARPFTRFEKIVPEVLVPGDFVIFQDLWNSGRAVFAEALRPVSHAQKEKLKSDHAL